MAEDLWPEREPTQTSDAWAVRLPPESPLEPPADTTPGAGTVLSCTAVTDPRRRVVLCRMAGPATGVIVFETAASGYGGASSAETACGAWPPDPEEIAKLGGIPVGEATELARILQEKMWTGWKRV